MKSNTKKILLLGIGCVFLFAMVILPLGVAVAIRPSILPDLDSIAGTIGLDLSKPFTGIDYAYLSWDGTIYYDFEYAIAPE
ncbi:MAG: hypothetical protein ACXADB_03435 [Candidatus Hermodarchaeia archaeon]|jgi:hypothetical protein